MVSRYTQPQSLSSRRVGRLDDNRHRPFSKVHGCTSGASPLGAAQGSKGHRDCVRVQYYAPACTAAACAAATLAR
eukprot:scaffold124915_cov32-Phaeocystis_antarctica.AAC.2